LHCARDAALREFGCGSCAQRRVSPFELSEPRSLAEALALLASGEAAVHPAGGCTALMLMMKAGLLAPARLVSLRRIEPRYASIEARGGEVRIGATCTLAAIERSPLVQRELPVVIRTLRTLANVRVRNVATLGGNLAHADPHMDLPPLLAALGATVTIVARGGERSLGIEDLISGYYQTALAPSELITEVRIPTRLAHHAVYRKITARSADDWPTLGVAVALDVAGNAVREAHLVASAAFDRPTRLAAAAQVLCSGPIDVACIARAADAAAAEVQPIADAHGSAAYKRELLRVHLRRALRQALGMQTEQAGA
jgi:carbon-monoxide dehydrogenase medium subunit